MKQKGKNIWFITLLMAMASISTAFANETDMGTWCENTAFGQNGANTTSDGYSLWDGKSMQDYIFDSNGDIVIRNAA